jgi:site-specific DNA recombinase
VVKALSVVGYTRCSSQEQAVEGISLEAQRCRVEQWCELSGAVLTEVVEDAAVSGIKPLAERQGGARIAELLNSRRPPVDAVVVVRLDRLARNAAETLAHLRRFANGPLGLVSIAERIDLSTPHGRALAQVGAVFAELERSLIAERTSDALRALRDTGQVYGPVPFGYRADAGRLLLFEPEHAVLKKVARYRSRGKSYAFIAERLNALGHPAKRGGQWSSMAVRSVMRTSERLEHIAP